MILSFPTHEIPSAAVYITVVSDDGLHFTAMRPHSDENWFDPTSGKIINVESISGLAYVTNDAIDRSEVIPQH